MKTQRIKSKHYVDPRALYQELIVSKVRGKLSRAAADMFYLIALNLQNKWHLSSAANEQYDLDDYIQSAMLRILTVWEHFNEEKTQNAFAYVTEILKRAISEERNRIHYLKNGQKKIHFVDIYATNAEGEDMIMF